MRTPHNQVPLSREEEPTGWHPGQYTLQPFLLVWFTGCSFYRQSAIHVCRLVQNAHGSDCTSKSLIFISKPVHLSCCQSIVFLGVNTFSQGIVWSYPVRLDSLSSAVQISPLCPDPSVWRTALHVALSTASWMWVLCSMYSGQRTLTDLHVVSLQQASSPQDLRLFYEKNKNLSPRYGH